MQYYILNQIYNGWKIITKQYYIKFKPFYGHYEETGYKMNVTETCSESKDKPNPNLITDVEVAQANTPDKELLNSSIEKQCFASAFNS